MTAFTSINEAMVNEHDIALTVNRLRDNQRTARGAWLADVERLLSSFDTACSTGSSNRYVMRDFLIAHVRAAAPQAIETQPASRGEHA